MLAADLTLLPDAVTETFAIYGAGKSTTGQSFFPTVEPTRAPRGSSSGPVNRSGMNGARTKVRRLLSDPEVTVVVVEHRDRLGRMNTELVEAALSASGRRLIVLDDGEVDDDLVRDMVEVLTSFCARLYGRRSARNRALKAIGCAQRDIGPKAVVGTKSDAPRREND